MTRAEELLFRWRGLPYGRFCDHTLRRLIDLEIKHAIALLERLGLTR